MDLGEMAAAHARAIFGGEEEKVTELSPEVQLLRLQQALPRFTRVNPFKIGDVVTPASDSTHSSQFRGSPHIVCELANNSEPDFAHGDPGGHDFGMRFDMRVIMINKDDILACWCESSQFEPYMQKAVGSA